jgi:hypothetical protein
METAIVQFAISDASTVPISMQPLQDMSFAQSGAPASPPEEPLLDPELDPLEEPLLDPELDPLEEPLLDPELDPLLEPLEEPLLEPLEEPLLDPELDPLSVAAAASSPPFPNPPPVPVLLDEHAASNPRKLPDAHTNLPIFSIAASSSWLFHPSQSDGLFSSYLTEPPRKRPGSLSFVSFSLIRSAACFAHKQEPRMAPTKSCARSCAKRLPLCAISQRP